jgi:hypothetical protein
MREVTREEAEAKCPSEFNDDSLECYDNAYDYCLDNPRLIEATARELAEMNVGTQCGNCDGTNKPFEAIAKMFPDVLVHTCIASEKEARTQGITDRALRVRRLLASSCSILVESPEVAVCIGALAYHGGGSLREDFCEEDFDGGPAWIYFETE